MRIGINARFLLPQHVEGIGNFTFEVSRRLVRDHPNDEFVFFFDRSYDPRYVFGDNVRPVVLRPPARHPLLWLWWFEVAVARACARYRLDVFLSADGFLSLRADVPTVLVVHDIAFERHPDGLPRSTRAYYRAMTPAWIRKAAALITVSEFSRDELRAAYGFDPARVAVVRNGVGDAFRPLPESARAEMRRRYAAGEEYFVHLGAIHPRKNVAGLLRAFDRFKERTGRSTKLLVVGRLAWMYDDVLRQHAHMVHGGDVEFLGYLAESELAGVVASSLALTCVSFYEGFGLPLIEAMACGVPVIAAARASLPEVAGDAALLVPPEDRDAIAAAMERVIADADCRRQLIDCGLRRAASFDWENTAATIWECLHRVARR